MPQCDLDAVEYILLIMPVPSLPICPKCGKPMAYVKSEWNWPRPDIDIFECQNCGELANREIVSNVARAVYQSQLTAIDAPEISNTLISVVLAAAITLITIAAIAH